MSEEFDRLPPAGFRVEVADEGGGSRIVPSGELDIAGTSHFDEAIDRALASESAVVIDLRQLTFIDSSGLRSLLRAARAAKESAKALSIVRGTGPVERALAITGVEDELPLVDAAAP